MPRIAPSHCQGSRDAKTPSVGKVHKNSTIGHLPKADAASLFERCVVAGRSAQGVCRRTAGTSPKSAAGER